MGKLRLAVGLVAASAGSCLAVDLSANPGPADNGGSPSWAIFMDFEALSGPVTITHISTANTGAAGSTFSLEVMVRTGTALGGTLSTGPGSSMAGWTSLGVAFGSQGPVAGGVSQPIDIPDIVLQQGVVTGVALRFAGLGPRYFGTGTPPLEVYTDGALKLTTGESRSTPFLSTGSYFHSRALVGVVTYETPSCYANCDGSTIAPFLNVSDFICFLNKYAAGDSYANCDGSTTVPVLNVADFTCFMNQYAACP